VKWDLPRNGTVAEPAVAATAAVGRVC